jgi:hypothetical protein
MFASQAESIAADKRVPMSVRPIYLSLNQFLQGAQPKVGHRADKGSLAGASFPGMRLLVPICVVIVGLYWADQTLYAGYHTREARMMISQIMGSYR